MDIEKFRKVLEERRRICKETNDEWDYGINQCFQEETKILSKDIDSTIEFLKTECTEDEHGNGRVALNCDVTLTRVEN